jgi:hypothetical protein
MEVIVFTNAISLIRVYPKVLADWDYKVETNFKLKIGRKWWGKPIYKIIPKAVVEVSGLWDKRFRCAVEDFSHSRFTIVDDKVYYKPHCELWLNNGKYKTIYLESVVELIAYVKQLKDRAPHIEIND